MRKFAIKVCVLPNENQIEYFHKNFGSSRLIFNAFLSKKINLYKNYKNSYYKNEFLWYLCNLMKTSEEYKFLNEVDKFALESAVEQVESAYTNFFEGRAKFPNFKTKRNDKQSYTTKFTNNNIKVKQIKDEFFIQIPKIKDIKVISPKKRDKTIFKNILTDNFKIKQATVSFKNNKYYISLSLEDSNFKEELPTIIDKTKIIGIDLGIKEFATIHNGSATIEINNPKCYRTSEKQLIKTQTKLSKKKFGSNNYNKQKQKLSKIHSHISNQRKDFLHKESFKIINENQVIIFEDLATSNLIKDTNLSKSISDCGWSMFITFCKYKAKWNNKIVLQADRYYASSKLCNICGYKYKDLELKDRTWECPNCKTTHNRDENASINLRNYGIEELKKQGYTLV